MNPAAILALISDLYGQIGAQAKQIEQLTAERDALLAASTEAPDSY